MILDGARVGALAFTLALGIQRLWELRISRRHEAALRAKGAIESGAGHYPFLVATHVLLLVGILAEVFLLGARPGPNWPRWGALFLAGQILRYAAMRALGPHWNVRVLVPPKLVRVRTGPYRWFPHPNYLAVVMELLGAPMMFGAWRTALVVGILDAVLLTIRIRVEEAALAGARRL